MFNRSKAQALALLTTLFVVGAAAGWGLTSWMHRGDRPSGRGDPEVFVSRLTKELKLTPEQRDSVRAVLARHRPQMDTIWSDVHQRVDSLRHVMRGEIFTHLTPGQRDRYMQLVAEQAHQRQAGDSARDTTHGGKH